MNKNNKNKKLNFVTWMSFLLMEKLQNFK